jgi:hypothetical protein
VADISYVLCSNVKGEATPATATAKGSKTEIMAYLKDAFNYCDGANSGFTDAHLNAPADWLWPTRLLRSKCGGLSFGEPPVLSLELPAKDSYIARFKTHWASPPGNSLTHHH